MFTLKKNSYRKTKMGREKINMSNNEQIFENDVFIDAMRKCI